MKRQAFTVVELLVVILIIVLLAALSTVALTPAIQAGRTEPGCEANLKQIAMAFQLYEADNGALPPPRRSESLLISTYHIPINCPLRPGGYVSNYTSSNVKQVVFAFPDGGPIPRFDPTKDVIYRCLDHAFEGFDRGAKIGWSITKNTKGRVLGVRLDGSVGKVSPLSCWEFGTGFPVITTDIEHLWLTCDQGK